ncbi:unnamed protein product [Arabidopsis thaliana]|uniref:(thale cress) hypothetical protein n=1 Tax=Arabidopsis thaliana TaxID=3702 RepID=A0A7G2ES52_ARATH|nr:unnamed protein product [Arabidopsis thaliana]
MYLCKLRRRCPRNKAGIIWFDQCFVEITAIEVMEVNYDNNFYMHNPNKVMGDAKSFNKETMAFLEQLALEATRKDNMEDGMMALYSAREKMVGTKKLYAMVQCTRDVFMFKTMCKECLERIISQYPKCCDGKQGGRVLGTSYTAHGEAPNSGNFVFQCRGDSYGSICGSCYATAVAGLRKRCQRYKGAIIWYDQCFLKVSTINSPPTKMDYENTFPMHNPNNINGDTQLFNQKMKNFLYELALKADKPKADGTGLLYYAAGTKRLGKNKLYAMVQCTLDIFHCKVCLEWSIKELSKCCEGKQGARVLGTSCNVRVLLRAKKSDRVDWSKTIRVFSR